MHRSKGEAKIRLTGGKDKTAVMGILERFRYLYRCLEIV